MTMMETGVVYNTVGHTSDTVKDQVTMANCDSLETLLTKDHNHHLPPLTHLPLQPTQLHTGLTHNIIMSTKQQEGNTCQIHLFVC